MQILLFKFDFPSTLGPCFDVISRSWHVLYFRPHVDVNGLKHIYIMTMGLHHAISSIWGIILFCVWPSLLRINLFPFGIILVLKIILRWKCVVFENILLQKWIVPIRRIFIPMSLNPYICNEIHILNSSQC